MGVCSGKSWSFSASEYHHCRHLQWSHCRCAPGGGELLPFRTHFLASSRASCHVVALRAGAEPLHQSPGILSGHPASSGSWEDTHLTVSALAQSPATSFLQLQVREEQPSVSFYNSSFLARRGKCSFSWPLLPAEQSLLGVPGERRKGMQPCRLFHWGRDLLAVAV